MKWREHHLEHKADREGQAAEGSMTGAEARDAPEAEEGGRTSDKGGGDRCRREGELRDGSCVGGRPECQSRR